jgi:hypothetical protein
MGWRTSVLLPFLFFHFIVHIVHICISALMMEGDIGKKSILRVFKLKIRLETEHPSMTGCPLRVKLSQKSRVELCRARLFKCWIV